MFSLCILDTRTNNVFCARDRFGIKPLFYMETSDRFCFASEIKALMKIPDFDRSPDINSLYHYLSLGYIPDELTSFSNIKKFEN